MSEEYHTILMPIQEEVPERPVRRCCCSREDIFLIIYITTVCAFICGGFLFILVWIILKATA